MDQKDSAIITVIEKTITNSKLQDSWKHVMNTYVNMSALLANKVPKVVHMLAQSIGKRIEINYLLFKIHQQMGLVLDFLEYVVG